MRIPVLIALAVAGAPLAAQEPRAPPPPPRQAAILTQGEALARADRRFDRLDTDRNGTLSTTERAAMRGKRGPGAIGETPQAPARADTAGADGGRMFERYDTDRDGAISRDEFRAGAAAMFTRRDMNRDGQIDAAERSRMRDRRAEPADD